MPLGIGNNLIRNGGVLNPDGLSLDLQFAADKTLTARRGPTPTFARASAATEVGPDGLIRYAPENLVLQSEEFDSATWDKSAGLPNWQGTGSAPSVTANDGLSPSGAATADRIVLNLNSGTTSNDRSGFSQTVSTIVGVNYTVSIYVKPLDGTTDLQLTNSNIAIATFGTLINRTVVDVGGGWKRIITTYAATITVGTFRVQIVGGSGINQFTGLIWGAQVERHSSARAYIPTTTAVVYAPRFDHDPVTLACKGLLIEEGRTNQITFSENLTDTSWSNFSTASAANITSTNPSGGTTTSRLTADSGTSTGRGRAKLLSLPSASYAATVSCFVKAGNSDFGLVAMYFNKVGTGTIRSCNANIVFSTGVITKSGPSNADFTVTSTAFPDGWYRITISATSNASLTVEDQVALLAGLAFNGTGGSGTFAGTETVLAWGAQIEAGSFPTSYIPTTTSTLARSADVCSITGGDFSGIYNTPEGTLFAGVTPQSVAQAAVVVGVNTANYINSHFILKADSLTTSAGLRWVGVSFPPVNIIPSTLDAANAFAKIAYAYKSGSLAMAYNNILAGTSAMTFTPINPTTMRIGSRDDSLYINGHISSVRYYRKRLPDAKLVTLTT
jgi:hypothetical protein